MPDNSKRKEFDVVGRQFETEDAAIQHAREAARSLGQRDSGWKLVQVRNEAGDVIAEIPIQRRHS
jgi:hypothetical protein